MIAEILQKKSLWDVKKYFDSIKINFYSIKYNIRGVRTIDPQENYPPVRVRVWVRVKG